MGNWRKSTFSNAQGGACVEVASNWRKSTFSNAQGGSCVELASAPGLIGVRDTKQDHLGDARTVLSFSPEAWKRFTGTLR